MAHAEEDTQNDESCKQQRDGHGAPGRGKGRLCLWNLNPRGLDVGLSGSGGRRRDGSLRLVGSDRRSGRWPNHLTADRYDRPRIRRRSGCVHECYPDDSRAESLAQRQTEAGARDPGKSQAQVGRGHDKGSVCDDATMTGT